MIEKNSKKNLDKLQKRIKNLQCKFDEKKNPPILARYLMLKEKVNTWTVIAELFAGIAVGLLLGNYFDGIFNTSPLLLIIFTVLGSFAGLYNLYRMVTSCVQKVKKAEENNEI